MARIKLTYPDGTYTYAKFHDSNNDPHFILNRTRYEPDDIVRIKTFATVNSPKLLRRLADLGIEARPSMEQATITISVAPQNRENIRKTAKAEGKSVSSFIEDIVMEYIKKGKK
jgi:predicted HicB family RNase H-like nuclease